MSNKFDAVLKETEREYAAISDEIADVIIKAADTATDFESFQRELDRLAVNWSPDRVAKYIALAAFKARAQGDANFDSI
jgi:hypothetical protein